jgi:pentafunctional AROM polypeptide
MEEGVTIDESIRQQCKFDLFVSTDRALWPSAKTQLLALTQKDQLTLTPPTAEDTLLDAGVWSHFVSLTYPSIDKALPFLPDIRIGADAWELRVDLLDDSSTASLHRQIALLRSASALPIVFTVRSKGQIGRFPDDAPDRMFQLLREGVRAGAEWIDVEACWPQEYIQSLAALIKGQYGATSRILGSLHVTTPQSEAQVTQLFQACELQGAADMVKVGMPMSSKNSSTVSELFGNRW